MIFAWNDWNIAHLAKHGVSPAEAEYVVNRARKPYPLVIDQDKRLVVGKTDTGQLLNVIFVFKSFDDLEPGSISSFDIPAEAMADETIVEVIFVIHAMPASTKQKRNDRNRRKP